MHRARLTFLVLLALLPRVGSAVPIDTRAYVTTTDFSTGALSAVTLASRAVATDVASVHSDATLRWWGGRLYVVNRYGQDNIQVIDPAQGYATLRQFSTGNGSNPQDIAVVSATKAYVSCYALAQVLVVDPSAGTVTGSVSLAPLAGSDGVPEAARMALVDGHLFVALQRLVGFAPAETSLVAVIDTAADTLVDVHPGRPGVQGIPLVGRDPVTTFEYDPFGGRLLIGCAGAFGALDGGIEAIPVVRGDVIDPLAPLWASSGFVITEQALGGDIGDLAFLLPGHSYATVSDASFHTSVVAWSALTGQKRATVYASDGFDLPDMAVSPARDELWVCDTRYAAPGLRVFRCSDDAPLAGPLPTGLPPYQIVFDRDDVNVWPPNVAVDRAPAALPPGLAMSAPWPNPARSSVRLTLRLPRAGRAVVEVFDEAGRRVRTLACGERAAGENALEWDLRDGNGNRVAAGVYVVRARVGDMSTARQLVAVR
jgi:hypothetical protein